MKTIFSVILKFYVDTLNDAIAVIIQTFKNFVYVYMVAVMLESNHVHVPFISFLPHKTLENVHISLANNYSTDDLNALKADRDAYLDTGFIWWQP